MISSAKSVPIRTRIRLPEHGQCALTEAVLFWSLGAHSGLPAADRLPGQARHERQRRRAAQYAMPLFLAARLVLCFCAGSPDAASVTALRRASFSTALRRQVDVRLASLTSPSCLPAMARPMLAPESRLAGCSCRAGAAAAQACQDHALHDVPALPGHVGTRKSLAGFLRSCGFCFRFSLPLNLALGRTGVSCFQISNWPVFLCSTRRLKREPGVGSMFPGVGLLRVPRGGRRLAHARRLQRHLRQRGVERAPALRRRHAREFVFASAFSVCPPALAGLCVRY